MKTKRHMKKAPAKTSRNFFSKYRSNRLIIRIEREGGHAAIGSAGIPLGACGVQWAATCVYSEQNYNLFSIWDAYVVNVVKLWAYAVLHPHLE